MPLLLRVSVRNTKFTGKKVHIKKINLNFSQQISGIYVHAYINNEFALKKMNLPRKYSITTNEENLDVIAKMIFGTKEGELIQIRAKMHTLTTLKVLLASKHGGIIILLNSSSYDGTVIYPFDGIHLTSQDAKDMELIKEVRNKGVKYIAASCHNKEEIAIVNRCSCDFITISPVHTAGCHPKVTPIGWKKFSELSTLAEMPTFALGGQNINNLSVAQKFGAYGISGVTKFW